ncbi:non-specific lipid transfer protein GPI-anchored 11-like [Phragmites australis]|uniref:non-specific lipid transfer protein GPI-anchored 11-like n=1 Tax=Phragmites australis TaxID=29695 RepID=UPI002D766A14|nr:non-specific lipid transfer protein GPI-anchored 11-like [Phragmites australis]
MAVARTTNMARSRLLVLSLAALATVRVDGAAPAPAPSVDCTDALVSLAGCLSYVQEGSTVTTPDPSCCSGLKDVVRKEVACLCQAFQGGQDYGVTLNMTKALQLPAACKVKTPPFSKCHIAVPGEAPAPAPSSGAPFFGESPSSSTPSASPAGTGPDSTTQAAPAPSPSGSDAVSFSASTYAFAAVTAAATLLVYRVL